MKILKNILSSNQFLFFFGIFSVGFCFFTLLFSVSFTKFFGDEKQFVGIIDVLKFDGNQMSMEILSDERLMVWYYAHTEEELKYLKNEYKLGDTVEVVGELSIPNGQKVFHLFDYQKYLLSKGIYWVLNADQINKIKDCDSILFKLKNWFYERILSISFGSYYLQSFILGDNTMIDGDVKKMYQRNGVSHLFAVSGMHVSLLAGVLLKILQKLVRHQNLCYVIVILFFLFYMFLTGFSPSVMRAVFLFILLRLVQMNLLSISLMKSFFYVLFCMLLFRPYFVYSVGFQFSFMVSFSLICFQKLMLGLSYFKSLFVVSLLSFFAGLPILLYHFFTVNFASIIFNLILVPFVSLIVFPMAFVIFLFPIFGSVFSYLVFVMEFLNEFFGSIDFFILSFPRVSILFYIGYYVILFLFCFYEKYRKYLLFVFIFILIVHYFSMFFRFYPVVVMIDVGQGDSILISMPHGKGNILIDTGGKMLYQEEWQKKKYQSFLADKTLIPLFQSLGVRNLDYLILSHGDFDHMGEAINLVHNFKTEKVIFNCAEFNDLEKELINVLGKKKITYYSCIKELNIEDNKLYFLNDKDYGNENDNSIVIYTALNNHKFLFMGDASVEVEEDLIEKYNLNNIDVLKVGHHGSRTSSSKEFINDINPKYSIVSVGKNNRYGHPNDSVLDNLENSKIYRTDEDGSIMFKIKNEKLKIETCAP